MHRWPKTSFAAALIVLTAVATTGAARPPGPAQPPIRVASVNVQVSGPEAIRPMDDYCSAHRPGNGDCGDGYLNLVLTGFDAYGGIPACPNGDRYSCQGVPIAALVPTSGTRVTVLVHCTGHVFPRLRSVAVEVGPIPLGGQEAALVSENTRIDSDTAEVDVGFRLPDPAAIGACAPGRTELRAEVVRHLTVNLQGYAQGLPTQTFHLRGVHRVELPGQ